jgi:hypothetical protein
LRSFISLTFPPPCPAADFFGVFLALKALDALHLPVALLFDDR